MSNNYEQPLSKPSVVRQHAALMSASVEQSLPPLSSSVKKVAQSTPFPIVSGFRSSTVSSRSLWTILFMALFAVVSAQTNVNMPTTGTQTYTLNPTNGATYINFYDSGGPNANFQESEDGVITFYPANTGNKIKVTFSSFQMGGNTGYLYIYNGGSTNVGLIGQFQDNPTRSFPIISTDASGALTIRFTSTEIAAFPGWSAIIEEVDCLASLPETTNNGLHFNGNQFVLAYQNCSNDLAVLPLNDALTIEYWFKGPNLQSAISLVGGGFITAGQYVGNQFVHSLPNDGGDNNGLPVGTTVTDGNWHHVAMTWQQGATNGFTSYLDGQIVAQRDASNQPLPNPNLYLGNSGYGRATTGTLDEVRVWTVARTQAQIQAGMNCGVATPQTGLLIYYKFDHGTAGGNNVVNSPNGIKAKNSANPTAYNGTLQGFALTGAASNWVEGKTASADNTPPTITCPTNIPCVEATSAAGAVVTYPTTATDNCSTPQVTSVLPSGSTFPLGTSTVVATATDDAGNSTSCTFTIKVCDTRPPIIICPNAISVNTDAGICGAVVTFNTPTTYDDFGLGGPPAFINPNALPRITQTGGLASGATFPVGTTTNVFMATDASGNTTTCSFTITVTDNEQPSITAPAAVTSCTGTGIVLGTPTTGDNCSVATVTNNAPTTFPVGTTTVIWTVTDINNNSATATQTVTVSLISLTPSVTAVSCNGGNTGSASVAVSGGNAPYTYAWSNGDNTASLTGLIAGIYTVTVTTSNACSATISVTVTEPQVLVATSNAGTITCNGSTTTVTVGASGGTAPYTGTGTFTKGAGTWSFTVTDKNGCTQTTSVTIGQPTAIVLSTPSVTNLLCNGGNTGKIVVAATGGTGAITYSISPIVGTQSPAGTFNNLTAGTYTITAKDANNCTKTATVVVTQPAAIDPTKCYSIINKKSGKLLDVYKVWTVNNTKVIQYQTNGGANQKWRFTSVGNGYVKIVAQHSGKVLANHSGKNGSECYQYDYFTGGAKDWEVECLANGYFKITHRLQGRVLDVEKASTANEAEIEVKDWTGGDSQQWQIVETTCPSTTYNLSSNTVTDITGHAEAARNVIGFATNQGFRSDYFTAEKFNTTTSNFEDLAIVNNTNQTDDVQYHTFLDNQPNDGENIYRVKTTYISGDEAYSAIIKLNNKQATDFTIYPNPASEEAWIDLKSFEGKQVTLVISDLVGKAISQEVIGKATTAPHRLDVAELPTGLYLVKVQAQGKRILMRKLQVTK